MSAGYASLSSPPLVLVEVTPLSLQPKADSKENCSITKYPSLSAPFVKFRLRQWSLGSSLGTSRVNLCIQWESSNSEGRLQRKLRRGHLYSLENDESTTRRVLLAKSSQMIPVVHLETEDPTELSPIPCWIVAYGYASMMNCFIISEATLVRVTPTEAAVSAESPAAASSLVSNNRLLFSTPLTDVLSGEVNAALDFNNAMEEEVLRNQDPETIESLKLRMRLLLSQPVAIGTTSDAFSCQRQKKRQSQQMDKFLKLYNNRSEREKTGERKDTIQRLLREGALTVHSPVRGAGKTLLVKTIARHCLHCTAIHVIQPGPLLAKYGIHADAGLETLIHGIAIGAAARDGNKASVCIILDQLDALLPPALSRSSGSGDAAVPVLNGIASYLRGLSSSLKNRKEMPFPTNTPLYNLGGVQGEVMEVKMCIVGVVTCPDDGGMSLRRNSGAKTKATILDALGGGQFRLPDPSSKTRLVAFRSAFEEEGIKLSEEAEGRLPVLAAGAVSARGSTFRKVAQRLSHVVREEIDNEMRSLEAGASSKDIEIAVSMTRSNQASRSGYPQVSFINSPPRTIGEEFFSMVGGNVEAKEALEDSLALDPERRRRMARLGFSAPTGVLLYGPPGTGKTLLAKAVANMLKSQGSSTTGLGGAFVSLRASDIVRSEVGNSEKLVVSAFETARSNAPSVIFIDEFQALFTERGGTGSGKLTSTLLQCMDDVTHWRYADDAVNGTEVRQQSQVGFAKETETVRVVVLAATNTPWMVDKAFLRPGRFDQVVHVGLPNLLERASILSVHVKNMRIAEGGNLASIESLCRNVSEKCDGFSGADLVAVCRAAAIRCLDEQGDAGSVEEKHFLDARKYDVSCSSSSELVERISRWQP